MRKGIERRNCCVEPFAQQSSGSLPARLTAEARGYIFLRLAEDLHHGGGLLYPSCSLGCFKLCVCHDRVGIMWVGLPEFQVRTRSLGALPVQLLRQSEQVEQLCLNKW